MKFLVSDNFLNEIVWRRQTPSGMKALANKLGQDHDIIYWYTKSSSYTYNPQYLPFTDEYIMKNFTMADERGRYKTCEIQEPSEETLNEWKEAGLLYVTSGGKLRLKQYPMK